MIASSDVENQISLARNAVLGFPELAVRFDSFVGKIGHKMCAQPKETAENILDWLKEVKIEWHPKEEIRRFLILLKQAVFMSSLTNRYVESFDVFYATKIVPEVQDEQHAKAAKLAWTEFLQIFEVACGHTQPEVKRAALGLPHHFN